MNTIHSSVLSFAPSSVATVRRPGLVFPKVGLASSIIGTAAAAWSVPPDCGLAGALAVPALVLSLGLILAPILAALRDLRSLVRAENVLASAPVYWLLLDLMQGSYGISMSTREAVVFAFIACGLFSVSVWSAALQRAWRLPSLVERLSRHDLSSSKIVTLVIVCFVLGIFYFLFMAAFDPHTVVASLLANRSGAAWSRNSAEGGWDAFVEHLSYFGMLLPALAISLGRKRGWFSPPALFAWVLALFYALFQVQGGNRRYLGVMLGAAIVVWLIAEDRPRWYHTVVLAISAATVLYLMQFVLEYRFGGAEMITQAEEDVTLVDMSAIKVDDNFLRLAQTIYLVPNTEPYTWYEYALFALIRPIPRALWEGKPIAPSFRVQDFVEVGASLSSSVVGELYASGGLLAVFLGGWLYGRLGVWGEGLLGPPRTVPRNILYGAWLMALFAGCRSMQDLVMMSYVVLALLAVLWFILENSGLRTT